MSQTAAAPTCPQFRERQLNLATATPLGAGAISHVIQSRLTHPDLPIAIKALSKVQLLQQNKVASAMAEKSALLRVAPHPFIGRLYGTAQSEDELYFVMEWLPHGDLLQHIRRVALQRQREYAATLLSAEEREAVEVRRLAPKPIPATAAALRCLGFRDIQLITAQLVLALARTAERGLVLRDLKPENIAFDDKYRACLIDFDTVDMEGALVKPETNHGVALPPEVGHREETRRSDPCAMNGEAPAGARAKRRVTVSEIQAMRKKTASFCGTAQYVSPEMVGECKWSYSSDLWALGAIVYEMVYGAHMFSGLSTFEVLQKVVQGATKGGAALADTLVPFPLVHLDGGGDSSNAEDYWSRTKDFILRLVAIDPRARLGVHREHGTFDLDQLRRHPFFEDFTLWGLLEEQVAGFRPRHIPLENEGASAAHAAEEDRTPSLLEHYNIAPFNDPQYADYVFRATADTNPFDSFFETNLRMPRARRGWRAWMR
ncbi:3-phosphoinositide dependent protein kinase-1 [Strigomonas culicis]|uniref:non-specific serine/threonine protein kinase n=1 Tax=Strigomonas culicis TaxID=28005 RepID=S9UJQ1_9TRYP|nr:3-phosphoinositide dependent protein kinase-1 [Strigomonas culicis]|eukprot:EPY29004.1 3-phosphoinositide dependent protein kinase-1 [Strigomonas culicis]